MAEAAPPPGEPNKLAAVAALVAGRKPAAQFHAPCAWEVRLNTVGSISTVQTSAAATPPAALRHTVPSARPSAP